ncbi:MAG: hypothetical protein GWN67_15130 [Phycisphaerae bacterium]|nr:hypothetical protein [Phycisphaerae bacterium]NIP53439.1 hypothetical protein [Phycisphaerae bacterium]NIS52689.1 hypothetical protein [Phycisphaerae bacterium]NIU09931.1 hypothetical protein [Phycisphaerae bacterium]NIU57669.1 hypothetical protein [Phycisphaerae bacterium]
MKQQVNIKEIEHKTFSQSQQDGLMELVLGICLLAMSTRLLSRVLIGMFPIAIILFSPILSALRNRFTYPRTGYVKLIDDKPKDVIAGIALVTLIVIAVLAVAFFLFANVRDFGLWMKWVPLWAGVILAIMFVSLSAKSTVVRYYIFAVYSLIAGLVLSILKFTEVETGTLLYFLAMGVFLAPFGLVLFIRFLRKHPETAKEAKNDTA